MSYRVRTLGTGAADIDIEVYDAPVKVSAQGLAGSETITFKSIYGRSGASAIIEGGVTATLSTSDTAKNIMAPGRYRLSKSSSAGSVDIEISGDYTFIE